MLCIEVIKGTRLGNWLFQYAVAKSVAKGGEVAFLSDDAEVLGKVASCAEIYPRAKFVRQAPAGAEIMRGYRQNPNLFDGEIVRREIVCPESARKHILARWGDLLREGDLASIHVRRGDFLTLPHRFPFVGKDYLRRCVEKAGALLGGRARFLVCSDDIPWCETFFTEREFPGNAFFFARGGSVVSDLFVPTFCKCNICSNSTYSWWGAYLHVVKDFCRDMIRGAP